MSKFTRDAIKQSFLKLLNERPLSQIKVRDIVSDCGVNRNTFYYYFHDIPSLVEEMVMEQAEAIIRQYPSADTVRDFFEAAISYILERKTLFLHIYHSSNREIFETYLWQMCEQIVALYIEAVLDGRVLDLTTREFDLLYTFLHAPGRVFTREMLLARLWGYDFYGDERVVDSHIKNLRHKLGRNYIETVRGVGYRAAKPDP